MSDHQDGRYERDEEDVGPVELPYDKLAPETLQRLLEEIVTRDGTDYGETETPVEARVRQAREALRRGTATLFFDAATQSCQLVPRE